MVEAKVRMAITIRHSKTGSATVDLLLKTTDRVVQAIDSIEYRMTDIQEYYANTGALKKAAENRKQVDPKTGKKKRVNVSVIEAFGGDNDSVPVREVEDVLRLEYRNKLLNPKWRDAETQCWILEAAPMKSPKE